MRIPRKLAPLVALVAALLAVVAGPASADPISPPPATTIAAVADPDLQYLCNRFAADYSAGSPADPLACWNATNPTTGTPGDTIETKNSTNCVGPRPYASTLDIRLLQQRLLATPTADHCVDIAFTSRNIKPSDGSGIASALFARDLTTYAYNSTGNGMANLTDLQLRAIYSCNAALLNSSLTGPVTWNEVGGTSTDAVVPLLPDPNTGTTPQWLTSVGVTTLGTCVDNGTWSGTDILADQGVSPVFTSTGNPAGYKDVLIPFSAANYTCQVYIANCPNAVGNLVLGDIDGRAPLNASHLLNVTGLSPFPSAYYHGEYAVVLNAGTATAPLVPTTPINLVPLLGQNNTLGWICGTTAATDIKNYGFVTVANCGALTGQ